MIKLKKKRVIYKHDIAVSAQFPRLEYKDINLSQLILFIIAFFSTINLFSLFSKYIKAKQKQTYTQKL